MQKPQLEILEEYMSLCEQQNEVITVLTRLMRKQAEEIMQLRNVSEYIDFETELDEHMVKDVTDHYEKLLT